MTYSCSDVTDDVVNELVRLGVLNADAIPDDDPEEQAKLVLEAIRQLAAAADATHTSQSSADSESSQPRHYYDALAARYHWNDIERDHAEEAATVQYRNECVISLSNGRELRCPAYPEECNYLRVTEAGHELMYWCSDEWRDDPESVMGAILGLAKGPVSITTATNQKG